MDGSSTIDVGVGVRYDTTDRTHLHFYRNIIIVEDLGAVLLVRNKVEAFHVTRAFLIDHIKRGVLVKHQAKTETET